MVQSMELCLDALLELMFSGWWPPVLDDAGSAFPLFSAWDVL